MIPLDNAVRAVADFASRDVVSIMPNTPSKFLAEMAVAAARANPVPVIKPYEAFLKMTGILSEDGQNIDEGALYRALTGAFKEMPTVTMLGFTFNQQDADKLLQRMTEQ